MMSILNIIIALNENEEILGTIRLMLNSHSSRGLPIEKLPSISENILASKESAEISRLGVDKSAKNGNIVLGLYRIMYQYSKANRISCWHIGVEPIFFRLLKALGFQFIPLGNSAIYVGSDTIPGGRFTKRESYVL